MSDRPASQVSASQASQASPRCRPTLRSRHQSHRQTVSGMDPTGRGWSCRCCDSNAGEAFKGGLEAVEHPQSTPEHLHSSATALDSVGKSPHIRPPQVSPAGGRDPATSTFSRRLVRKGIPGVTVAAAPVQSSCVSLSCPSLCGAAARLYPRTWSSEIFFFLRAPRKELRPDLPMRQHQSSCLCLW